MKKTTYLMGVLAFICSLSFAQETSHLDHTSQTSATTRSSSTNSSSLELQLNEENQDFYNRTGVVRCLTDEINQKYIQNNPNARTNEQFEQWIAPLVEEHKARVALERANGTFRQAVVEIPIIFHVISGGVNDAANLDAIYVNAQITQLNLDFGNLAGGTNGPWSAVAADAQIVFVPAQIDPAGNPLAEPGINRVFDYPGVLSTNDFDNTIKPATSWDRTRYCNNWTGNLGNGLLGYAQFPDNSTLPGMPGNGGAVNTDGVVNLYSSIGSVDTPNPAGGVYGSGRTLTHEVGHWIGLRHIWGDGGCNVDDFCADTPSQGGSSNGCPTTANTCPGGQRDMVENFMDYSFDVCMNLFTSDQVARMAVVLANSPGRSELPNSNAGQAPNATISFASPTQIVNEGTDCSFTDVVIPVNIGQGATANTTVNLSVSGGTANTNDFNLLTNAVTFSAGATAPQQVTLRVFNDGFVEGNETVDLSFTVSANGGDAVAGLNNTTITILEDDIIPSSLATTTLFEEDFDPLTSGLTIADLDGDTQNWGLNDETAFGTTIGFNGNFALSRSWDGTNGLNPDNLLFNSDAITIPSDISSAQLSFISGTIEPDPFDAEFYSVYISTSNDPNVIISTTAVYTETLDYSNGGFSNRIVDLTPYAGQDIYFAFRHHNTFDMNTLIIDEIEITATVSSEIQTLVNNNSTNDLIDLGQIGTIYSSDAATSNMMADITNTGGFDYECLDVSVNRAGSSAQPYNGSTGINLVMDKTFKITPTNTSGNNSTTISFYVTQAELSGITGATGLNNNQLFAYRDSSDDIIPLSASAFGNDFKLTGTFTGINGTYYIGAEGAFKTRLAPKVFLSGPNLSGGLMDDSLRSGGYLPTTSPYSDNLTANASVFNATGANAIVDWVWIELRDANDNTLVSASKSAFLQRDGDVVDLDGTSSLTLNTPSKSFYVVINHRNHLAVMTRLPIALSATPTAIDFTTNALGTFGSNAQSDMGNGNLGLWAGDLNGDGRSRFAGPGNDTNTLKSIITNYSANTSGSAFFPFNAYSNYDLNLNGQVRFAGPGNDANVLKDIIVNYPINATGSAFFPINQQLPN
jgi:hypothetical protein